MSKLLRVYKPAWDYYGKLAGEIRRDVPLAVVAVVGGKHGYSVLFRFTIQDDKGRIANFGCVLSQKQVEDLIDVLQKRIRCEKGYCATDPDYEPPAQIVYPDGKMEEYTYMRDIPIEYIEKQIEELEKKIEQVPDKQVRMRFNIPIFKEEIVIYTDGTAEKYREGKKVADGKVTKETKNLITVKFEYHKYQSKYTLEKKKAIKPSTKPIFE